MAVEVTVKAPQNKELKTPETTGSNFDQVSAGSTGLAQLMIYQLMALFMEIIKKSMEQKSISIKNQIATAKTEAARTKDAADTMALYMMIGGALSIVGAGVGYLLSSGRVFGEKKEFNQLGEELSNLRGQKAPMDKVENLVTGKNAGIKIELDADKIALRRTELKNGVYESADDGVTVGALTQMKNDNRDDYLEFQNLLTNRRNTLSSGINTRIQEKRTIEDGRQARGQMANSITTSFKGLTDAWGQQETAGKRAEETLARTASGLAAQASNQQSEQASGATQQLNREVDVLRAIHQTEGMQ